MAFIRKKIVSMDGISIAISPLLCKEADAFLTKQQEIVASEDPIDEKVKKLGETWLQFIADGLNTAAATGPTPAKKENEFTVDKLQGEFDKVFLDLLKTEIADMSGIGIQKGGVQAPSTSPS